MEWFRDIIAAGVPCGPINTVDGGVAFAEDIGLDPVVDGRMAQRGAVGAQPDHVLGRRRRRTGCRRRSWTNTAPNSAAGCRQETA